MIEDSGPGLPDYAGERVFERFYSLKHSVTGRKGSGLGLALDSSDKAFLEPADEVLRTLPDPAGIRGLTLSVLLIDSSVSAISAASTSEKC